MKHRLLTLLALFCAGALLASVGTALFWVFDNRPVLSRNISTPDGELFQRGGILRIFRDVVKERDCPMVEASHHLFGEGSDIIELRRFSGALVSSGKHEFAVVFRIPKYIEPGTYYHALRLHFQCNPLRTSVVRVRTKPFEIE